MLSALINSYQSVTTFENLQAIAKYLADAGIDGRKASARLRAIVEVTNPGMDSDTIDARAKSAWDSVKIVKVYNTREARAKALVAEMLAGKI